MEIQGLVASAGVLAIVVGGTILCPGLYRLGLGVVLLTALWAFADWSRPIVALIGITVVLLLPLLLLTISNLLIWVTRQRVKPSYQAVSQGMSLQLRKLSGAYAWIWNLAGTTSGSTEV